MTATRTIPGARTIRLQTSRTVHPVDITPEVLAAVGNGPLTVSRFLDRVRRAMALGRHGESVGFFFDGDRYVLVWGRRPGRKGAWRNTRVQLATRPAQYASPAGTPVSWDEDGTVQVGTSGGFYRLCGLGVTMYQVVRADGTETWTQTLSAG